MAPEAVQIINTDLNENNSISLNVSALKNILLREEIRNKKICVISITGTFRQGKSFLLNFFLRYLKLKHGTSPIALGSDWLDPKHGSHFSGFLWKHGCNAHTSGILMWPEIFTIYKPSSNEEIAVVLLDTQGSYDNQTTTENSATIFALSTIMSSVQMYNVMRNLNQNDLESVEMFGHYGRLFTNDDCPFQDLWILVRDWLAPYEKPFGIPGDESLLQDRLYGQQDALPDEISEQRNNIRNLFQTIQCSLLPFPGERVATDHTFNGNLNEINDNFKLQVKQLVECIFEPENLVIKRFNGEEITANDLFKCFDTLTEILRDGLPHIETRLNATITNQHNDAIENSFALYDRKMHDDFSTVSELNDHHEYCITKALDNYHNTRLLGDSLVHDEYKQRLIKKIGERFSLYKDTFCGKIEQQLERERTRNQQLLPSLPIISSIASFGFSLAERTVREPLNLVATGFVMLGFGLYGVVRAARNIRNNNFPTYSTDDDSDSDSSDSE